MKTAAIIQHLKPQVPRGQLLSRPAQLAAYECDGLGFRRFPPDLVVIPADADELIAIVKALSECSVPWTVRGAGTSLSGGPVAAQGGVVLHLSNLNAIQSIDVEEQVAVVECGVVLAEIDTAARAHGLHYPPDASSGAVCTIGGNVACNSGGAHCFRYGVTSDYVLGVEVILPDGRVERFGGAAGGRGGRQHDWKRLLIGSEGTLGVFTRFWLRLIPPPERVWTFQAVFSDIETVSKAISDLSRHPAFPSAIELMDPRTVDLVENSPMAVGLPRDSFIILTEIDGPPRLVDLRVPLIERALKEAGAVQVKTAIEEADRKALWQARKVQGGLLGQISPDFVVQDAVVPKAAIANILSNIYKDADEAGIATTVVIHAGDGNMHPNFMFDSRDEKQCEAVERIGGKLMEWISEAGGTLSGEHGIGNDKSAYMQKHCGPVSYMAQSAIPMLTNPQNKLNPLKILNERRFDPEAGDAKPSLYFPYEEETNQQRLFAPFIDPIDMVACFDEEQTLDQINAACAEFGLCFPLFIDGSKTISEHLAVAEYAPASARFGAYVDNVLGMNWQLTSGAMARVGERVVKSTTGYDIKRFLLHTDGRFGKATHYVLRLRPIGGERLEGTYSGNQTELDTVRQALLSSSWIHWIESMDLLITAEKEDELRVAADFLPDERTLFSEYFQQVASSCGAVFEASGLGSGDPLEAGGTLPAFSIKTLPNTASTFARNVVAELGGRAQVLLNNGVILLYPEKDSETNMLDAWSRDLAKTGGHIHAPFYKDTDELDLVWADALEKTWEKIT